MGMGTALIRSCSGSFVPPAPGCSPPITILPPELNFGSVVGSAVLGDDLESRKILDLGIKF
jgi:hypothetical protein